MSQKIQNQADRPQGGDGDADNKLQGEGNYEASRRYRDGVGEFLAHADVEDIAHKAAPKSPLEARELALAADKGQQRSKGDDPADVRAMYPGGDDAKP